MTLSDFILIFISSWTAAAMVMACLSQARTWSGVNQMFLVIAAIGLFAVVLVWRPDSMVISNAVVLLIAIGGGLLLGKSIGRFGALVTFAITVSVVDLLSFGGGLTRHIIEEHERGASNLLQFLAITIPIRGHVQPIVGAGDLFILGALFLGLVELHRQRWRAGTVLTLGLTVAIGVGLFLGGVAGLPFLAAAGVIDGWWFIRMDRRRMDPQPGN